MNIKIEYEKLIDQIGSMIVREQDYRKIPNPFPLIDSSGDRSAYNSSDNNPYPNAIEELLDEKGKSIYLCISKFISGLSNENKLIKDIYGFINEINQTIFLSESFFSIEKVAVNNRTTPIRTHLFHPTVVYLLGKGFLHSKIGEETFENKLVGMLSQSKMGIDAIRFAGYQKNEDPGKETLQKGFQRAWCISSLSHDLAYCIWPALLIEKRFFNTDFLKESNEPSINSKIKVFKDPKFKEVFIDVWDIIEEYFIEPIEKTKKNENNQLNHGQLLTVFLLNVIHKTEDFKKMSRVNKLSLFLSLVMIFRHDEWSKYEHLENHSINEDPLTAFFCLNDLLAEMRYVWKPVKKRVEQKKEKEGIEENKHKVVWELIYWLPYVEIELTRDLSTNWKINFKKNNIDDETIKASSFDFYKSTGESLKKGKDDEDDKDAKNKREQYKVLLRILDLAKIDAEIEVNPESFAIYPN